MPEYSEYIQIKKGEIEFYNHYRGDKTFMCDMLQGVKEARRIIKNQIKVEEFKSDNPFSRIIINEDSKEIYLQLGIPENKNRTGNNLKELFYYSTSQNDFMKMLNKTLEKHNDFPIEINFYEDKEWTDFKSVLNRF